MKRYHFLFGYTTPNYTSHFLKRYAERIYNVVWKNTWSWLKYHQKRNEITERIYNSEMYNEPKANEIREKYGANIVFLKWKKIIFVVKDIKDIVTCYRI